MTCSTKQLDEFGLVILPNAINQELLGDLNERIDKLFEEEADSAGSEFKRKPGCRRLANLVNKGDVFTRVITNETVLPHVAHVVGDFKLSSLNLRSVNPGSDVRQPLHSDTGYARVLGLQRLVDVARHHA
ncbi:MAG: hypothetical protein P8N76_26375 [Pirellulaceae bacterium]|nr:hypothetical protein [Pirellulaceae bacterium]